jgi:YidC/Oxa1 family membrane protein insertase
MTPLAAGILGIEHFTPPWDVFFLPLFNGLIGLYELLFSDLAVAIIVFTIIVRTLLAPLFNRQIRSQKEMQRIQPLIREVNRKYKGDRQKISQETMAVYREHGVNPAAGCLPLLLQAPILFALYQALARASSRIQGFGVSDDNRVAFDALQTQGLVEATGRANEYQVAVSGPCNLPEFSQLPQFLPLNCQLVDPLKLPAPVDTTVSWLHPPWASQALDLADIDRVFAVAPFGFTISAIAVVAAILQFVQVKMTMAPSQPGDPTAQATSTMVYLFPIMTIVWGALFPSGLLLYWVVYTAYLIFQQFLLMGWGNLFPLFGWAPPFARTPAFAAAHGNPVPTAREPASAPAREAGSTRESVPARPRPAARRGRTQRRRRGQQARRR